MNSSYEQKHPLYAASFTKRRKAMDLYEGGERIEENRAYLCSPLRAFASSSSVVGVLLMIPSKLLSFCSIASSTCFKGFAFSGCSAATANACVPFPMGY